jgi:hypothetical protein
MRIFNVNPHELLNLDMLEASNMLRWEDGKSIGFYEHVSST